MKITEKNKKGFAIGGLILVCLILAIAVFLPNGNEDKSKEDKNKEQEIAITAETAPEITVEAVPTAVAKPTEVLSQEKIEDSQDDIVSIDDDKDVEVQLTETEKETTEPPKPTIKGDTASNTEDSASDDEHQKPDNAELTDKSKTPTYSEKQTEPQKKEEVDKEEAKSEETKSEPQSGTTNEEGQVYVPGFGYITSSGENDAGTFDSEGSLDEQVGTMN